MEVTVALIIVLIYAGAPSIVAVNDSAQTLRRRGYGPTASWSTSQSMEYSLSVVRAMQPREPVAGHSTSSSEQRSSVIWPRVCASLVQHAFLFVLYAFRRSLAV
jgi:hypothetical protein